MLNLNNNKIITIVILATVFGFGSGIVGEIFSRAYILQENFNIPFFTDVSLLNNGYGSNLVIRGAKNVVVEQNAKVTETVDSVSDDIVGIFKKKNISETKDSKVFNLANYYQINQELGQGYIITSDGWIITNFSPEEFKQSTKQPEAISEKLKQDTAAKYVVITKNKNVYIVDDILPDPMSSYSFWHVQAKELPVGKFGSTVQNGQLVLAVNWGGCVWLSTVLSNSHCNAGPMKSSDEFIKEIVLAQKIDESFTNSFLFNLEGELIALVDQDGKAKSFSSLNSIIDSLLKDKKVARSKFGVNYINLSALASPVTQASKGALIYKNEAGIAVVPGSPAQLAGLLEKDIIVSVNNIEIDEKTDLSDIISQYSAGEEVSVVYIRDGDRKMAKVKLAS